MAIFRDIYPGKSVDRTGSDKNAAQDVFENVLDAITVGIHLRPIIHPCAEGKAARPSRVATRG